MKRMKVGDDMMVKKTRILKVVVAVAVLALVGTVPWAAADQGLPRIGGMRAVAGAEGPVIRLSISQKVDTVQYSPQPGVWVVELPEAEWDAPAGSLVAPGLGIERAQLARADEFGRRVTRLTVRLTSPATLDVAPMDGGLELHFADVAAAPAAKVTSRDIAPREDTGEPGAEAPAPAPEKTDAGVAAPERRPGTSLTGVTPEVSGSGLVVHLRGDGPFAGKTFSLSKPNRIVVDLPGVVARVKRHAYRVDDVDVARVRVAQFRAVPVPITRVVVDLLDKKPFTFTSRPAGGDLIVGAPGEPVRARAAAAQPAPPLASKPEGVEPGTIEIHRAAGSDEAGPLHGGEETLRRAAAPGESEPAAAAPASAPAALPPVQASDEAARAGLQQDEQEGQASGSNPWVADPKQLLEQASAQEVLGSPRGKGVYATKEVSSQERQFTGEPITLRLKDADIKDVLRTFASLTNLNIVVDPSVTGSVTVDLHDVPWDQALDLILKINGLDYVLENNVLRVAPTAKLAAEKRAKANLAKEQENAQPLKTVLKPLSYSKASYIKGLLTKDSELLSSRGSVVVDERTNTLIIRDVVDRVEGVLRLIDSLDRPTPQVVIEGRIVETTRDFSHELGVNWGFTGVMDAAHGNDTGLKFPNSVGVGGGVNLGAKETPSDLVGQFPLETGGVVALTFGDILNTFNLDFTLRAAEEDGLVKIISSPRVTTQNNEPASVQSGLQIPVQTVANNTVTVQYIDATLKLEVTPQITAEGTVLLDVKIRKREPAVGVNLQGGQNAPIFTRDAQTKLLVRDGGTTVIAGIYQINDQTNENRVPGLSKIPILGALFRNKKIFNRHDELLIFITPRIVKY